ncbi:MAG: NUDIX domain-containing protein [Bauldia sp.]|nr:NUDIX domain-containing protein [Bauldia sp.]
MQPPNLRFPTRAYLFLNRFRNGMTLGVRAAVFDDQGRIFLVRHSYVPGWYMPGGGVDKGESMQAALRRELLEEAGIGLTGPAELFGIYWNNRASPRDHVAFYVCRDWQQRQPPPRNFEIVESGFFPTGALPPDTTDATRRRLEEIATGSDPAAEW